MMIENRTFDEIAVGQRASVCRTLTEQDIALFALVSGDVNPAHMDSEFADAGIFHSIIAHGMWGGGLISSVLGTQLPGPGTIYLSQSLRFLHPVRVGDNITATVTVTKRTAEHHIVVLECQCTDQHGNVVIEGQAEVKAPTQKVRRPRIVLPDVTVARHQRHHALLASVAEGTPVVTAVAHPCDTASLLAVTDAARRNMITPVLVGPQHRILAAAAAGNLDISQYRLVDAPHSHGAAAIAVALVRNGEAQLLMKGALHTDELMSAVMDSESGLRTDRRLSHVYLMDVPSYPRPLLITDAAINITPTLDDKADIIRNAIDLAHAIGIAAPRVAILAAVETVNPRMRSTLDAAALCKMADRGQITGGVIDGPLAFDNAISPEAAQDKGIVSQVAGCADILVVPDLEAGNMLAKQLTFLAGADAAGIVLGGRVPIILTSRADSDRTRIASCALAVLMARRATGALPDGI